MRLRITALLSRDDLTELVAHEMRRRFSMPDAEISLSIKSWGETEVTIIEPEQSAPAPVPSSEETL